MNSFKRDIFFNECLDILNANREMLEDILYQFILKKKHTLKTELKLSCML